MLTDQITRLADTYAQHRNLKLSTVSTYAANDGKWLENIRRPEVSCTIRKAHSVVVWFSEHWPADLDWPADIPRPAPAAAPKAPRKSRKVAA